MASKAAAFHAWASGFGIPAYPAASVPERARMPYLTYSFGSAAWVDEPFAAEADLWYPAESGEAAANAKAEEIGAALGAEAVGRGHCRQVGLLIDTPQQPVGRHRGGQGAVGG